METLIIDWENSSELVKIMFSYIIGFASFAGGIYAYIQKNGIKLASIDKVAEYKHLKDVVGVLTKNISKDEFMAIVGKVIEKKNSKTGITAADAQEIGNMLIDAIATEEPAK